MALPTKERILDEIRRTTELNGGTPLGQRRFTADTGIPDHAWRGRFWSAWGDALAEAGFAPNVPPEAHDEARLLADLVTLCRRFGRFPTESEIKMERQRDATFPSIQAFRRSFGAQPARISALREHAASNVSLADVVALLPHAAPDEPAGEDDHPTEGFVYLLVTELRSGKRYKLGRTEAVPRRHRQIALEMPETPDTVHVIATDDPVGIEAYWHHRFAAKRTNGEWFALSPADVRAFKRRKFM